MVKEHQIILASQSPRRKELLSFLFPHFEVYVPNIEEKKKESESILEYIQRNAHTKALTVQEQVKNRSDALLTIIAADTVVVCDGELFEKPLDKADARRMLTALSQKRCHNVYTALCVITPQVLYQKLVESKVYFRPLQSAVIERYIESPEPYDKAGAYAVQGYAASFIEAIEGSYTNVVGLPLAELMIILENLDAQNNS